jgi:hypothetical protein
LLQHISKPPSLYAVTHITYTTVIKIT